MEELHLIERVRDRNKHAMNFLLSRNYDALYGFLLKLTGDCYLTDEQFKKLVLKSL